MADSRFFDHAGPVTLGRLAELTGASLRGASDNRELFDVAPLETATDRDVSFLDNVKYLDAFSASRAGACFVREKFTSRAPQGMALLVTETPYLAYALTARLFYPEAAPKIGMSPLAHIAADAIIGARATIGPYAVIGRGVSIGDDCIIGSHVTISHALIGNRVIIHPGARIGQDGFGFAPSPKGLVKVPQLGRVLIGHDVEIGAGTCIDRGAGPDTMIGDGSKIDNLVQIGHNVRIGRHVVIAAQTGVSGSTHIEDGVMIGGQAGLAGHLRIGAGVKLAAQSGVMADIPPKQSYGGTPAVPIRDWHRQTVVLARQIKKAGD